MPGRPGARPSPRRTCPARRTPGRLAPRTAPATGSVPETGVVDRSWMYSSIGCESEDRRHGPTPMGRDDPVGESLLQMLCQISGPGFARRPGRPRADPGQAGADPVELGGGESRPPGIVGGLGGDDPQVDEAPEHP